MPSYKRPPRDLIIGFVRFLERMVARVGLLSASLARRELNVAIDVLFLVFWAAVWGSSCIIDYSQPVRQPSSQTSTNRQSLCNLSVVYPFVSWCASETTKRRASCATLQDMWPMRITSMMRHQDRCGYGPGGIGDQYCSDGGG